MAPPDPSGHVGPLPSAQVTSLDASVGAPLGTPLGSHHAPLSWGYPAWNTPVSAMPGGMSGVPPGGPRVSVKRALSESEDCDDAFSEDSASKDCSGDGDEADSCQLLSRKKRRGVIEKRRRDRINTSLTELRRLVPSAFEKQGSAKLEKAEILQMTVDHLKMLHAKGMDALAYDPQRFAMDYHSIGFRECAAEVARYLVTVEGLDIQDPLRLRLMSHLQCFAAQRELASKQAATATWSYPTTPSSNYGGATATSPAPATPSAHNGAHSFPTPPSSGHGSSGHHLDNSPTNSTSTTSSTHGGHHYEQTPTSCEQTPTSTTTRLTASPLTPLSGYPPSSPGHPHPYYHSAVPSQYPYHQNAFNHAAAGAKPYRPWGAEVAY